MSDQLQIIEHYLTLGTGLIYFAIVAVSLVVICISWKTKNESGFKYLTIALSAVGLIGAGYLAYRFRILGLSPQCSGAAAGCEIVERSQYSTLFGVHMSEYGMFGYLGILLVAFFKKDLARLTLFLLTTIGFAVSIILTYLELWQIKALCQWCVGSAVIMTMLFLITAIRIGIFYGRDEDTN